MSAEKLYQEVRSGRVKLDQLNDEGKAALKGYMAEKDKRDRETLVSAVKTVSGIGKKVAKKVGSQVKTAVAKAKESGAAVRQQEEARRASLNPYERWYEDNVAGSFIGKALGSLQKADDAVSRVKSGVLDTATLGATQGLGRDAVNNLGDERLKEAFDDRRDSTAYKVGEFAGYIPPGVLAEQAVARIGGEALRRLPWAAQALVRGGASGALDMAGQEVGDVAFRQGEFDPENVALGAGLGAGIGVALPAAVRGVQAYRNRGLNREVEDFLARVNAPRGEPAFPTDRIVRELPGSAQTRPEVAVTTPNPAPTPPPAVRSASDNIPSTRAQDVPAVPAPARTYPSRQELSNIYDEIVSEARATKFPPREPGELDNWLSRHVSQDEIGRLSPLAKAELADEISRSLPDREALIHQIARERGYDIDYLSQIRRSSVVDPISGSAAERAAAERTVSSQIGQQLPEGVQGRVAPGTQAMASAAPPPAATGASAAPSSPPVGNAGAQAGAAGAGTPPPAAPTTNKTISRTKLVNNIKRHLGVTVDTGRTGGGKGVLGVYKVQPEVIRSAAAQDYDTIAHEIGHDFTKKYGLKDPRYEQELIDMMDTVGQHDYRQYPRTEWHDEGIAEYMRVLLQDPQKARQLAPQFSAFMDSQLPRKIQKGIQRVQGDVRTWIDQGDYNQAKGLLDYEGQTQGKNATRSKMYTRFFDDLHPIEMLEKALRGKVGIGAQSMYKLARLSRGVGEQAQMAATRGIFDSKGNKLSEGLRTIVQPLEKIGMKQDDFGTYLAAIHAQDLKAMGKQVPFTDSQLAAVVQKWGSNAAVQKAQKEIVQYNNALMGLMVEAQIFDAKTVAALRQKYPNYVPFLRYFDDDAVAGFKNGGYGSGSGFANLMNPVKRMSEEGSTRTIINPLESMVKNTFLVMNAAAKNKVGLQLADLAKVEGAGAWVEHVPGQKSGKEHIVDVWTNGKKQAYKIRDPELYNAMLSLDHESTNSLIKFLGGAAGMLRAGATLTPEFMVRNVFRDVAGAIVNSTKYGFNPLDFFKGFFHTVTKSDVFEKFVNSGGAMSTMMSLDRDMNREALEAVFKRSLKDKAMNVVTNPKEMAKWLSLYKPAKGVIKALRKGAEISELSTKVGAFNKTLKKTGDIEEAAYTARDLMDFNRAGSSIRQANRAVAFLNASLQGTDKMFRAFKQNPASFLTRAFTTLVAPAAAVYYWNQNLPRGMKEKYDNIPQWQKDTFYVIGIPGIDEFVRIPKPFEAGMLFSTSTDRMLRWIEDNDPDAFKGYGRATAESMTPPMMLTALSPILEAMTNHSFFRDAPVVPRGEQRLQRKDQYGIYTSELSKEVAQFLDSIGAGNSKAASPRIIDNTLKGYTAGLGTYATDLIDMGIEAVRGKNPVVQPEKKWTEDPFFRSFFVSTAGGGRIREDFYRAWEKVDAARASADFNDTPLPRDTEKKYEQMRPYKREIDKLSKEYKEVQRSKTLSSKQKRSQLDSLDAKMNEAARKALGK